MELSRRRFVQLGGAAAAATAVRPEWLGVGATERPPLRWKAKVASDMPEPDLAGLLLNRAAFGPRPGDVERVRGRELEWIEEQLDHESIDNSDYEAYLREQLPTLSMSARQLLDYGQNNQMAVHELRLATIHRMVYSPRQLHEVMVEFWTDHFSIYHPTNLCRYLKTVEDQEVIRKHALGNFKDLLTADAMSPAMLNFLDNDVSQKERPNENYAREIMELHTLDSADADGYPYTEEDVKEVARCFTGWTWDRRQTSQTRGEFEYRDGWHDQGAKFVLGNFIPAAMKQQDGMMVIELLCEHEATGPFLAKKLIRRFVTDDPEGQVPGLLQRVSEAFYRSKYDIKEMLRTILTSQEFADSFATYEGRLSRPMDLLARMFRTVDLPMDDFDLKYGAGAQLYPRLVQVLSAMGHIPFYWPTPDGYPDVKEAWVASAAMLTRWNYALTLQGVGGSRMGGQLVRGFVPAEQTPSELTTAGEVVDYWIDRTLHRPMLDTDRAIVIEYLTEGGSATTPIGSVQRRLPETLALIMDSPYFQWR